MNRLRVGLLVGSPGQALSKAAWFSCRRCVDKSVTLLIHIAMEKVNIVTIDFMSMGRDGHRGAEHASCTEGFPK